MSEDTQAQGATTQDTPQDGGQTFDASYVKDLRQEAAGYRTQLRDVQAQLEELKPLAQKAQKLEEAQMSEVEKLTAQLSDMKAAQDAATKQAAAAAKQTKLVKLAAKAGVPVDVLDVLNVDAFDLDDAEGTLARLQALAPKQAANGGTASNPARGRDDGTVTPEEWYKKMTGRQNTSPLFGG